MGRDAWVWGISAPLKIWTVPRIENNRRDATKNCINTAWSGCFILYPIFIELLFRWHRTVSANVPWIDRVTRDTPRRYVLSSDENWQSCAPQIETILRLNRSSMRHSSLRVPVRDTWRRFFFKARERGEWRKYQMFIDLFELLLRFSFLSCVFYSTFEHLTRNSRSSIWLIGRWIILLMTILNQIWERFVISWIFFR